MDVPPSPPDKDLPPLPAAAVVSLSILSSPYEPPKRPLPPTPTPTVKSKRTTSIPQPPPPTKAPPIKQPSPLSLSPPTRPGTAATETSQLTASVRFPGSTKRLSWNSIALKRPIKYGKGKYSNVELVPQPSDDPDDPLNWPSWRKELNFYSLMLMVAMTGVMKTIFMTVNGPLSTSFGVSYSAAACLTGVPLILSAISGFICLVASRICGKRPLYLASLLLVFIGAVWNTNVERSYGQCMAARVFQGLGWGAFDTLVLGSIQDTYFEHERGLRIAIYSVVTVTTTWGPPLIGGVASETREGFSLQFMILSAFFVIAVPAIALGAPETSFDRAFAAAQVPGTAASTYQYQPSLPASPRRFFSLETFNNYIVKLKPYAYSGPADLRTLLQVPRAAITPTVALITLVTFLPFAALWGLGTSFSLLLSPSPLNISPSTIGTLFTSPWILSITVVTVASVLQLLPSHFFKKLNSPITLNITLRWTPTANILAIAAGTLLTFIGVLTLGLYLNSAMAFFNFLLEPSESDLSPKVNLAAVSFLFGLLAAGAYLLASTTAPLIASSTAFTSSSLASATRNTADMTGAVVCYRSLVSGIFAMAVPKALLNNVSSLLAEGAQVMTFSPSWSAVKSFGLGVAIAQLLIGVIVAVVWWVWGGSSKPGEEGKPGEVKKWDGKVMKLVGGDVLLGGLERKGSFFELD